jgi:ABC-2 type transport system permease protein
VNAAAAGAAVVTGLHRGLIELRQNLTSFSGLLPLVWFPGMLFAAIYFLSGTTVPGSGLSVGSYALPGLLGANLVFHAVVGLASALTIDREDGTLLRARAVPFGVLGHLVGRVVCAAGLTAASLVIFMVPAAFAFDDLALGDPAAWLGVAGVLALGLAAVLPLGALMAAASRSYQALTVLTLPVIGLLGISGVFYPLTALAGWLQAVGQAFPVYWVALGMRSALLPDAAAVGEVGGSWRPSAMIVVLVLWAVVGFAVGPAVLRRMARRTSGRSLRKGPVGMPG